MTQLDDGALARLRQTLREPDLSGTRYELVGVAGTGGMGTVYVVEDGELRRRVALKVLDVQDAQVEERLQREARVLARLEHPGIVPVHDVGRLSDGRAYYTMKLVEGERLDRYAQREVSLPERLRVFLRIAEAVAFAHARGVLHRDLKPQNVMIGSFGEVLVLDWGLAKVAAAGPDRAAVGNLEQAAGNTGEGAVLGTPGFMAPEQQAGASRDVDARADVFSLGAVLQALLPPRAPAPLQAIARKAMSQRPDDRYPSAVDLAADVARFLEGAPVSSYPENLFRKAARLAHRHRIAFAILAAYLVGRALILLLTHR
jgi:eukaryotic-like serine/threonine-protein kinase